MNSVVAIAAGLSHSLALGYLNDYFTNRAPITGSDITFRCSNVGATAEFLEPGPSNFGNAVQSIWYTWVAPFSGGVIIEAVTDPSTVSSLNYSNPALAVYTG